MGAVEDGQRTQPIREIQREATVDHPADGKADQRGPVYPCGIHQARDLLGIERQISRARRRRALPMTVEVIEQHGEVLGEGLDHGIKQPPRQP